MNLRLIADRQIENGNRVGRQDHDKLRATTPMDLYF